MSIWFLYSMIVIMNFNNSLHNMFTVNELICSLCVYHKLLKSSLLAGPILSFLLC